MSHKTKIIKGSASNLVRVALSMLLAFVLPRLLVHRLSPAEYSAWVLILQISAYISLLDLGLQTVRSYRKTMMKKLGVNNVAGLTQVALAAGITRFPVSAAGADEQAS